MVKLDSDHGDDHVNDGQDVIGFQSDILLSLQSLEITNGLELLDAGSQFEMVVFKVLREFAGGTSIHGFTFLVRPESSSWTKIIWAISLVVALTYATLEMRNSVVGWIENPIKSVVLTFPLDKIVFPTVTLCPRDSRPDRWGSVIKVFDHLNTDCGSNRNCSDVQKFFYELSSKTMEPAFLQTKKIIQKAHENCRPMSAWNENSQKFARCTEQLKSISWLGPAFEDIENFAAGNMNSSMPIEAQIGQLGKMTIIIGMKQTKTNGIETAIQNIKHMSESITTSKVCSEIPGCQEKVRRTILQLLMME